ncbi:General secretion pathway protein D [Thioalkalivibrio nitratireducens DSM 14787]|uniref:General secretion pathway protein D n=1 Tax=Thioalkalivibrio nitratireducens (strain DSM 14787 / UNIQEM 213 / ALEN2) TaxID=1255043 RepID=L0E2F0_THIND|nr:type II secretion system secretin GspD [Thioalkalivibrio nitratireducens]AGA35468.1 General secretion pathway protein D [Thioalkalivibrio nitratireducens DSM 14787]
MLYRFLSLLLLVALGGSATGLAQADTLTLNLRDAEIQTLIDLVAEETGTNFIVDPRVRGRVSVVSGRPVARSELYDLFLGVLKVYGFAAVPSEAATKIVPDVQAKQGDVPNLFAHERLREDEIVTHVIQTEHVSAAQLVPILRPLVPQGGHLAAATETNALLVSDTAGNVRRIRELVARIDQPAVEGFEVIELRHANARRLAEQLRELETGAGADGQMPRARLRVLADERANAIILAGDPERRLRLRALVSQLDSPVAAGNTQVHYLRYAQAEDVVEVLRGIAESRQTAETGGDPRGQREGAVRIQAHQSTNAVVIFGAPEHTRDYADVIEKLDIRRAQVLVEAVIAEVSSERARELGVQWAAGSPSSGVGLINFDRQGRGLLQLGAGIEAWLGGSVASPPNPGDGLSLGGIGSIGSTQIAVLISALQGDTASNILSTPSLLTLDNEEAEIVVGQNVPFVVGRSLEDSGQAFDTIRREDIGVKLRVRPQINEGDAIRLEIEQEVSQIAPKGDAADLVTNTRTLRTHVMVDDGEMLVLGGLISESRVETRDQIPGLGDIPGLGRLFRYDSDNTEKRNLMVFLYPRIVRTGMAGAELTSEKYSFIRQQQLREAQRGGRAFAGDTPVMADWEQLTYLPPPFSEVHRGADPGPAADRP